MFESGVKIGGWNVSRFELRPDIFSDCIPNRHLSRNDKAPIHDTLIKWCDLRIWACFVSESKYPCISFSKEMKKIVWK